MPDPRKHADQRNIVESILRYIPGFHGYLEKEYRRESDYLARKWMADRLQSSKSGLDNYMRSLVDAGQIAALPSLERVRARLDHLVSQIRADVRGYSGFFDYVRVKESVLDEVYEHDYALMQDAQALAESIEQLAVKADTPDSVANDLLSRIDTLEHQFQQRRQMLEGIGPDASSER